MNDVAREKKMDANQSLDKAETLPRHCIFFLSYTQRQPQPSTRIRSEGINLQVILIIYIVITD